MKMSYAYENKPRTATQIIRLIHVYQRPLAKVLATKILKDSNATCQKIPFVPKTIYQIAEIMENHFNPKSFAWY